MKIVISYGTFDLFHFGHARLLKRLRNLGDRLVVGLSTDKFSAQKNKKTIIPYKQREEILRSIRYVDDVFPETSWEQKEDDIKREKALVFAIGDDWAGKFDYLNTIIEVVYLPRTPDVSTTELKQVVSAFQKENIRAIRNVLAQATRLVDELESKLR